VGVLPWAKRLHRLLKFYGSSVGLPVVAGVFRPCILFRQRPEALKSGFTTAKATKPPPLMLSPGYSAGLSVQTFTSA